MYPHIYIQSVSVKCRKQQYTVTKLLLFSSAVNLYEASLGEFELYATHQNCFKVRNIHFYAKIMVSVYFSVKMCAFFRVIMPYYRFICFWWLILPLFSRKNIHFYADLQFSVYCYFQDSVLMIQDFSGR